MMEVRVDKFFIRGISFTRANLTISHMDLRMIDKSR